MWQVIWDSFKDTLIVFPFILVIYILIELLENATSITKSQKTLQGNLAPLLGAVTGVIPQCGFSVMAAKLYDKKLIRTGTIMAVFIATSDEALIILLGSSVANSRAAQAIMPLLLIKIVVAIIVGYAINFLLSGEKLATPEQLDEQHDHAYSCGREHEGKSKFKVYFLAPLLHSLKITLYLFIVNLVFGFIIYAVGEDAISSSLSTFIGGRIFQPFITAAIGLIPNCASSAIITQTYVESGILFGSLVAGLCTNAGLGLVVLLKNTKEIKRNVLIVLTLYLISVAVGMAINGIMLLCGIA
jgi:hypothetical protein